MKHGNKIAISSAILLAVALASTVYSGFNYYTRVYRVFHIPMTSFGGPFITESRVRAWTDGFWFSAAAAIVFGVILVIQFAGMRVKPVLLAAVCVLSSASAFHFGLVLYHWNHLQAVIRNQLHGGSMPGMPYGYGSFVPFDTRAMWFSAIVAVGSLLALVWMSRRKRSPGTPSTADSSGTAIKRRGETVD